MSRRRRPCRSSISGPCSLPPSTVPKPPSASHASRWAWVVGLVVTLALLTWALHDIDPRELVGHLRRADPLLLLAAVALATLTFPLRTLRWQLILRDVGGQRLPLLPLWHATAIGFMANNLRPVRAGEFARAYAAQQQLPVRFSTSFASVGVERVLDGLLLVGLMMLAIASPAFPGHAQIGMTSVSRITVGAAVFFGAVLVVAVLVVHRPAPWLTLLRRATHAVLPERIAARLTRIAEGLIAGLEVLKSPARFSGVLAWSLLQWLVNAAAFAACFRAFGLAVPPEGALLLQGIIGFGVALPASPGFVGVFEAATRVTLAIYGIDATRAVRAARAVLEASAATFGVTIELTKRIPVRAGLGGGSSDAAAALHAVNALAGNVVPRHELLHFGVRLGADVPFLASGAPAAVAWGRGERLFRLDPPPAAPALVAVPRIAIATPDAYRWWDALYPEPAARGPVVLDAGAFTAWGSVGRLGGNDFEIPVFGKHPALRALYEKLAQTHPLWVRLCGSGSAVAAVYSSERLRDDAALVLGEKQQQLLRGATRAAPAPGPEPA